MKAIKYFFFVPVVAMVLSFVGCNHSSETAPEYNPNECTKYSCPVHKDKTSTTQDFCPECGKQMIMPASLADSVKKTEAPGAQTICDSFACYQTAVLMHTEEIISDTKEEQPKHILQATESFLKSINAHDQLKGAEMPDKSAIYRTHHVSIDKYEDEAQLLINALNDEVNKPDPDQAKIQELAKKLKKATEAAAKEREYLKDF